MQTDIQNYPSNISTNIPTNNSFKYNFLLIVLIVLLSVTSCLSIYFYKLAYECRLKGFTDIECQNQLSNNQDSSNLMEDKDDVVESFGSNKISKVSSSYKAYVDVNKDNYIIITPIDSEADKRVVSEYGQQYNGGTLGLGNSGINLAPDLEKFAFIDSQELVIVSVDGQIELRLPIENIMYITDWSPDSSKLLIYVKPQNIESGFQIEGMGERPETITVKSGNMLDEFVLIDFEAGTIKAMEELDGLLVYHWVDSDSLILSNGSGQAEEFYYYSMSEKIADRKKVSTLGDVFGQQMSFSKDGKIWSTVTSVEKDNLDKAKATIGNFPTIGDIASTEYGWATRQMPIISPDGKNVALRGYEVSNGPEYVYVFDGQTIEKITEGSPKLWLDDFTILFTKEYEVYSYNIKTKAVTKL